MATESISSPNMQDALLPRLQRITDSLQDAVTHLRHRQPVLVIVSIRPRYVILPNSNIASQGELPPNHALIHPANRVFHLQKSGQLDSANMVCLGRNSRLELSTAKLVANITAAGEDGGAMWRRLLRIVKDARVSAVNRPKGAAGTWRGKWVREACEKIAELNTPGAGVACFRVDVITKHKDGPLFRTREYNRVGGRSVMVDNCEWTSCSYELWSTISYWGHLSYPIKLTVQDNFPGTWEDTYINGSSSEVSAEVVPVVHQTGGWRSYADSAYGRESEIGDNEEEEQDF